MGSGFRPESGFADPDAAANRVFHGKAHFELFGHILLRCGFCRLCQFLIQGKEKKLGKNLVDKPVETVKNFGISGK